MTWVAWKKHEAGWRTVVDLLPGAIETASVCSTCHDDPSHSQKGLSLPFYSFSTCCYSEFFSRDLCRVWSDRLGRKTTEQFRKDVNKRQFLFVLSRQSTVYSLCLLVPVYCACRWGCFWLASTKTAATRRWFGIEWKDSRCHFYCWVLEHTR